jgi:uncharacterized protein (TIGR02246 family)
MEHTDKSRAEIEALLERMIEAWNRHDVDSYCAHWVEDADFVNAVGMRHQSRAALEEELKWLHSDRFARTTLRIIGHSVRFLNGEAAIVHMLWQMDGDPGMPGHPSQDGVRRGVFTHVVARTAAGWRMVASQNTDRLPVADAPRPQRMTMTNVGAKWADAYA